MAATLWRTTSCILRRSLSVASARCAHGPPSKAADIHKGKVASDDVEMPDTLGHAVGIEREELLAREAGDSLKKKKENYDSAVSLLCMTVEYQPSLHSYYDIMELLDTAATCKTFHTDPFQLKVIKRSKGSFEEPTIITSPESKRIVGCICEEDALSVNWMYLHKGEPKRCECGFWFKLVDAAGEHH